MNHGPYSPYKKAGEFAFISGQVGINPKSKKCSKKIQEQTKQALKNLELVLNTANLEINDIIKTTVFLVDMSDFKIMNRIYEDFFTKSSIKPARSTVAVKELPRIADQELLVEIEAIAYCRKDKKDV